MDLEELKELIKYQKKINIKRNLETKNLLLGEELILELIERCEKAENKNKANVVEIGDHMALSCRCGHVKFNLLRTGNIECSKCSNILIDASWSCNNIKSAQNSEQPK